MAYNVLNTAMVILMSNKDYEYHLHHNLGHMDNSSEGILKSRIMVIINLNPMRLGVRVRARIVD